jgi:hypothetical protein
MGTAVLELLRHCEVTFEYGAALSGISRPEPIELLHYLPIRVFQGLAQRLVFDVLKNLPIRIFNGLRRA